MQMIQLRRRWDGRAGEASTDPSGAAQSMLHGQKGDGNGSHGESGSGRRPGGRAGGCGNAQGTFREGLAHRPGGRENGGLTEAWPSSLEPLWIVLGPGDTSWAFLFVL